VAPILAGLVIVAGVASLLIFVGDGADPGVGGASEKPVNMQAVASYDPQGDDGQEHPEAVPRATDDSLATYWTTESYRASLADLGKDGVGIVLDAGRRAEPKEIVVRSDTPGFTAEIRAGSRRNGPFDDVAAEGKQAGSRTVFDTGDAAARFWLLWITDLGENSSVRITEAKAG